MTRVVHENVLNSMSGKVSGVTINNTGGTGSTVSMVIRGATSLSTDNQPLFVVDGVPIANTINNVGGFGDDNRVDYGNAISDLDPESIEDVTILKAPSAAALYGTRAGNGVVLITTKKATMKLLIRPSHIWLSANSSPNHLNVKPSQGVTWGMLLVLKATTDIKTNGRNRYTKNSIK